MFRIVFYNNDDHPDVCVDADRWFESGQFCHFEDQAQIKASVRTADVLMVVREETD